MPRQQTSIRQSDAKSRPILKPVQQHGNAPDPTKARKVDSALPSVGLNDQGGGQENQRGAEGTFYLESSESLAENEKVNGDEHPKGQADATQAVQKRSAPHRRTRSVHFED